jgi:glutamate N-acetyltransferase/amino-acid N-acetyltransferase
MELKLPHGFKIAGVHAGVKQASKQEDVSLFVALQPCVAAGTYTTNLVHAYSVDWNRAITPTGNCRAIVANSGNANACTGKRGEADTREMAQLAASQIGASADQVLVLSTGIIGHFLPMEKIIAGIADAAQRAANNTDAIHAVSRAMMTTDTKPKIVAREISLDTKPVRILGFAKGAGMIGPNMATMHCVILTDASLTAEQAATSLKRAVDLSFNCVSVDGHMSTSDSCLMLASGDQQGIDDRGLQLFEKSLTDVCIELAQKIASDGEGATHMITIEVAGCQQTSDAQKIAKNIANSALVKTALAGNDPNWGRIVSAAGYAGVTFDPDACELSINRTQVFSQGMPTDFDAAALSESMKSNWETLLQIRVGSGASSCRFWTCDLTAEYIRINADYHT